MYSICAPSLYFNTNLVSVQASSWLIVEESLSYFNTNLVSVQETVVNEPSLIAGISIQILCRFKGSQGEEVCFIDYFNTNLVSVQAHIFAKS